MKNIIYILLIVTSGFYKSQTFTSFTSAGTQEQYVPVVFKTVGSDGGIRSINIARGSIHEDRDWLAHGIANITAIGNGWGSGGNSISLHNFTSGFETIAGPSTKVISFVGRVLSDTGTNNIIVFLRGGTSYETDGTIEQNNGNYSDISGNHNLSAVLINDPLYNLPKGSYYSNYDINTKTVEFVTSHTGNVGIGIGIPNHKLDVNGTIHAKEVKVDLQGWADFVFSEGYNLPKLEDIERHIKENGHLPNVPSEKEVLLNGINLGQIQTLLLQKIEELTLYSIDQNKQIKSQSDKIKSLELDNQKLNNLLERIVKLENKTVEQTQVK